LLPCAGDDDDARLISVAAAAGSAAFKGKRRKMRSVAPLPAFSISSRLGYAQNFGGPPIEGAHLLSRKHRKHRG